MKDIAPELLEKIRSEFEEKFESNKKIKELYKKIKAGKADYNDAQNFAQETGKLLAEAFDNNLSSDILPDGRLYYNIANRVIPEMLELDHNIVSSVAAEVQKAINKDAGIGIKAVKPELNTDKVGGIVNIVSGKANFDDIKYMLIDPVINFSQCIVDDTVQANAKQHYKAGLNPKIKRTTTGKCCKWCSDVAGTLDYEEAKKTKDIFRRHKGCRCLVEYLPGDGRRQDIHTKAWSREVKSGIIQKRQYVGLKVEDSITKQIREDVIPKQKIDNVVERQNIHRKGTSLYEERKRKLEEKGQYGPSYITISDNEIIYLVAKYSGTGIIRYNNREEWNHQETIITNDKIIGVVVDNRNGNFAETSVFKIHYEKNGIHIVPDYPSKKR